MRTLCLVPLMALLAGCGTSAVGGDLEHPASYEFGACQRQGIAWHEAGPVQSFHVSMRDGVRIALDVVLPLGLDADARIPTVLTMTRYWRGAEGDGPNGMQEFFARAGYAVVWGDVRGTGASFGVWPHHRARDETLDFGEIIAWIAKQPWSDGSVAAWGTSYTANTADWMPERQRPELRAVISRFPDYDPYTDLYFPGGVPNAYMGRTWGLRVKEMDLNVPRPVGGGPARGVRPVQGPDGERLLKEAIRLRRDVPDVWQGLQEVTFKDDRPASWGGWSMDDWGIHSRADAVQAAATPIISWGSWLDAGTANGVLRRFMTLSNPQRVIVGAFSHGARHHVSPYLPEDAEPDPPVHVQRHEDLCFLQQWVRGLAAEMDEQLLVYYTMGEERWKTSKEWPIPGTRMEAWYFADGGRLATSAPAAPEGADEYRVDFEATTGTANRWATNNTGGDVVYADRAEAAHRLLTYTSEPLTTDLEVTGQPIATLYVTSTHEDGAFFVYLEDVAPDGTVRYLTEGMLRALHRRVVQAPPHYRVLGPYRSYRRDDAMPLVPGRIAELRFELLPVSALIRAGHRVRISIAGADQDTFRRIPARGTPTISVSRHAMRPSHVELPIVPRP